MSIKSVVGTAAYNAQNRVLLISELKQPTLMERVNAPSYNNKAK
jgi:hypothetical protein